MRVAVCANLPYYITSPVIMRLLEERLPVEAITVMVQKEAGDRLTAPMPSRECGAVTAAVRFYTRPEKLFPVGPGEFYAGAECRSCVIRLAVRRAPPLSGEGGGGLLPAGEGGRFPSGGRRCKITFLLPSVSPKGRWRRRLPCRAETHRPGGGAVAGGDDGAQRGNFFRVRGELPRRIEKKEA